MDLRVEYYQNVDTRQWGFVVPRLRIVGGGVATRAEAEDQAREAIIFALESNDDEPDLVGHDVDYFRVTVEKAS